MKSTIVYIAHPDADNSSSQQFLLSAGQSITDATFIDLTKESAVGKQEFNQPKEQTRLLQFDRIVFQFPLYWYQAPAILKRWLDLVLEEHLANETFSKQMHGKELGLVVTAGVKAEHFQAGGREQVTLNDLFTPYQALANYYQMAYLAPFMIHQFDYLPEKEKMQLIYRYACYLNYGSHTSKLKYQAYLLEELANLTTEQLPLEQLDQAIFDAWRDELEDQAEEMNELYRLTDRW